MRTTLPGSRRWRRLAAAAAIALALGGSVLAGILYGWPAGLLVGGALAAAPFAVRALTTRLLLAEARRLTSGHGDDEARFTRWSSVPVDPRTREGVRAARAANGDGTELRLARVDQQGHLHCTHGPLPFGREPDVEAPAFRRRKKYDLDIVLRDGAVLMRKDFRRRRDRFAREWRNLSLLAGHANVPAIFLADPDRCVLYINFVPGRSVRDLLASADRAAGIRRNASHDPGELDREARATALRARERSAVGRHLPKRLVREIARELDRVHAAGVAGLDVKTGNVVVDSTTGSAWLIDFEAGRRFRNQGIRFAYRRDRDRVRFNEFYGPWLLTESAARRKLSRLGSAIGRWYAPLDLGQGLTAGSFWSVDSGTGRWEYLNGRVVSPVVRGRRVLDLGSNIGMMPLLMLRAGAREVVGVELGRENVEAARVLQEVFEWRDLCSYRLRIVQGDMYEEMSKCAGGFDVVTAFCSLYYLSAARMLEVVRRASGFAPTIVLQANREAVHHLGAEATEDGDTPKAVRASVEFLRDLLHEGGYPSIEVHDRPGFSRPLLVGSTVTAGEKAARRASLPAQPSLQERAEEQRPHQEHRFVDPGLARTKD